MIGPRLLALMSLVAVAGLLWAQVAPTAQTTLAPVAPTEDTPNPGHAEPTRNIRPSVGTDSSGRGPQNDIDNTFVPGEIIVRWADPHNPPRLPADIGSVIDTLLDGQIVRLAVPPGQEEALAQQLAARPEVVWAQPNYLRRTMQQPRVDDPRFAEQWALPRIRVPEAWELTQGAPFVVVAVIDSGIDLEHPDLKWRLVDGYNFVERGAAPQDDVGHGTHAAGIIAATANNGIGVAGVAPNVSLMPLKALRIETSIIGTLSAVGEDYVVAEAMRYAVDKGAWIINMSFDGRVPSPILEEAVGYATARGVVLVAAAGNGSRTDPSYPAATKPTIAVAATDNRDVRMFYTNYGPWIDVAAPGQDILSTSWHSVSGSVYRSSDGTSTSAPLVAGVVGLLFSVRPTLTIDEIMAILRSTADPLAEGLGGGRVNARRAVEVASLPELVIPTPLPTSSPMLAPAPAQVAPETSATPTPLTTVTPETSTPTATPTGGTPDPARSAPRGSSTPTTTSSPTPTGSPTATVSATSAASPTATATASATPSPSPTPSR